MDIEDGTLRSNGARRRSAAPREPLVAVRTHFPRGFESDWHSTNRPQLIYPSRGVMTLSTDSGSWVVPPMRACWVPAATDHAVATATGFEMHSVYCDDLAGWMPATCEVVPVAPLLREMILALAEMPPDQAGVTLGEKLDGWLAAQLTAGTRPPSLSPPRVSAPALRPIAEALLDNPADGRSLTDWSRELGSTTRTLTRAFSRDLGLSFTQYRRQVRLHTSLVRLAQGQAVTQVAMDLGFSSAASFIADFRRATGQTPGAFQRGGAARR